MKDNTSKDIRPATFIDLFAGCGGLSLGLLRSGWRGLFAIERSPDAFSTLQLNLVDGKQSPTFDWPEWLPIQPWEIGDFIDTHRQSLEQLKGKVQMVAGGPPCQGFSFAGRRQEDDPRNQLFRKHLELVDIIKPQIVLLENVQGMNIAFGKKKLKQGDCATASRKCYAEEIYQSLEEHGYEPRQEIIRAFRFGVPQLRPRFFTIGVRKDLVDANNKPDFFAMLEDIREQFLRDHGLPVDRSVTVAEAISDLTVTGKSLVTCEDTQSPPGFMEIAYVEPGTYYQKLMHGEYSGKMNSLRLPNHRPETIQRFKDIQSACRKGVQLSNEDRRTLGIKKHAIVPLHPDLPSHTLTTLPDDLLHYSEPRVHTVREHARIQSFPDWFEFKGKYTTGGDRRTKECPRYTQVGNAVPPLLAEAIGTTLLKILDVLRSPDDITE